jgi:3-oxoacyl-[acyl-carrier protein] reductase
LEKAARLAVFLASAKSDGITGKLISAIWDPWESFPDHLDDLKSSDVFTLRRISLDDRSMNWGGK